MSGPLYSTRLLCKLRHCTEVFARIQQRDQCILFSVVNPFSPHPPRQWLGSTCHLSRVNQRKHCIAGAGLSIHMIVERLLLSEGNPMSLVFQNVDPPPSPSPPSESVLPPQQSGGYTLPGRRGGWGGGGQHFGRRKT